jgi:hypothetical protein
VAYEECEISRRERPHAYLREAQEQVFDAHIRAFAFFVGVTAIDWQLSAATNSRYGSRAAVSIVLNPANCCRSRLHFDFVTTGM